MKTPEELAEEYATFGIENVQRLLNKLTRE